MSATFACVLAVVPVTTRAQMSQDVVPPDTTETAPQEQPAAADDCLAKPTGQAPQGQHWSYRTERGTQRRCWYLHDKPAATATAVKPAAKTTDAPAARPMAAPQPRPSSEARAELPPARGRTEPDAALAQRTRSPQGTLTSADRAAGANADDDGTSAVNAPRAIQTLDTMSAAPATAEAAPAPSNDAADTSANVAAAPEQPADAMAPTDAPPRKTSLQMLMMVIFGALFFAGLTASLIPRLSYVWRKRRARLRRRTMWQSAGRARKPSTLDMKMENPAPIAEEVAAPADRADVRRKQDETQGQIEELLSGIAKQGQRQRPQGQIEELLSGIAKRVRRQRPQGPAPAVANSPAAAAARGRRSSARRGARV